MCELPRECRLVLVVYGRTVTPATDGAEAGVVTQVELGWSAIQFFNYDGLVSFLYRLCVHLILFQGVYKPAKRPKNVKKLPQKLKVHAKFIVLL